MRKFIPLLLIAIMALSVLSCAGVVSAIQAPSAALHPNYYSSSPYTIVYYPGRDYVFAPKYFNYRYTDRSGSGIWQAYSTAFPKGVLYAYAFAMPVRGGGGSSARASAGSGVWVTLDPNGHDDLTTHRCTVYVKIIYSLSAKPIPTSARIRAEAGAIMSPSVNLYDYRYVDSGKDKNIVTFSHTDTVANVFAGGFTQRIQGYAFVRSEGGAAGARAEVISIEVYFN